MDTGLGIRVSGFVFNEDGTTLGWTEFIEKIESVGLEYTGKVGWVDTEGKPVKGIEESI